MGLQIDEIVESTLTLVDSMRRVYSDSVADALLRYKFSFVISDPRLPDNPIVYVNEEFSKITGYSREDVMGRNCRFLQGPDTDRRTVLELRDAMREERPAQVRILNYTKDRTPFWSFLHVSPVFSRVDGTAIHFVGVQTPIPVSSPVNNVTWFAFPSLIDRLEEADSVKLNGSDRAASSKVPLVSAVTVSKALTGALERSGLNGSAGSKDFRSRKPRTPEEVKDAVKCLVSQLVLSSRLRGGVDERRCKQTSEFTAPGVVCSSLMLSLTRIQQSFVLTDPNLPDMPIVHASDIFLNLTGYSREEVVGRNCRFLQGPETDPTAVSQIRDSIKKEKPCSVRVLNYRKDKTPFWNQLHVSPVRSCGGKVAFTLVFNSMKLLV